MSLRDLEEGRFEGGTALDAEDRGIGVEQQAHVVALEKALAESSEMGLELRQRRARQACVLAAIAEALSILAKDGADLAQFCEIVSAGGGMADTPLFRARAPLMLQDNQHSDGRLRIGAKDIGLACAFADEMQLQHATPLFHAAQAMFLQAMDAGFSEVDTSSIARIAEQRAGVSFTAK